jgi:PAS domain S-box-containing protein
MFFSGRLEVKCPRCKTDNVIDGIGGPVRRDGTYSLLFDRAGVIIDADKNATAVLGYSREELVGMRREQLQSEISPDDYLVLRGIITDLGSAAFDTVHRKKNGEVIPVTLQIRVLISEGNQFALIIGRPLEIHQNDPAAPQYRFSINAEGRLIYVSLSTAVLLEQRWISLLGKPVSDFFEVTLPSSSEFFQQERVRVHSAADRAVRLIFHPTQDDYGTFSGYDVTGFSL